MSEKIIHVNENEWEDEVLKSDIPVIVDFWAPWCAPCRIIEPVMEELSVEYDGKMKFAKVNTDENQNIAIRYGIMGIPTVKIFKDGDEIDSLSGAAPKEYLKSFIDRAIGE
ncbi:thioredoxin [bacterium]|nr:MAG: thioredoxin [bacterium]